jgi:hypothetical protein
MFSKKLALFLVLGVMTGTSSSAADLPLRRTFGCSPEHNRHRAAPRVSVRVAPSKKQSIRIARTVPPVREGYDLGDVGLHAAGGSGVSWGPTPGIGQLGAVADSYIAVSHCWVPQPVFDDFGVFVGQHLTNICLELHP